MNAHKFVAEKGIDEAKRVLELASDAWAYDAEEDCVFDGSDLQDGYSIEHCNGCFLIKELKQVVESVEIVETLGGTDNSKGEYFEYVHSGKSELKISPPRLAKAIDDYELIESYKEN